MGKSTISTGPWLQVRKLLARLPEGNIHVVNPTMLTIPMAHKNRKLGMIWNMKKKSSQGGFSMGA